MTNAPIDYQRLRANRGALASDGAVATALDLGARKSDCGAPWRDLPERYGKVGTVSSRFYR